MQTFEDAQVPSTTEYLLVPDSEARVENVTLWVLSACICALAIDIAWNFYKLKRRSRKSSVIIHCLVTILVTTDQPWQSWASAYFASINFFYPYNGCSHQESGKVQSGSS
ncbi:uncharacterized protein MELLADRAFT_108588 [Melampsora larici-populina 98AG31]|uniref:Uncharacterized protein n=1 Tax=Melampsora larici-populina (strain 98AG31 / pathotype 3-4-7) TaxID=747676 RepID=F4RTK8_MELLP|nr:uncharacterized protein MELLADRAFT_108588 [Melampsora larici-populina 98AG31]EGG04274.1 hypothetical protein MELLADRAFT_108588 [Melampsora larici-populina 98AG31]